MTLSIDQSPTHRSLTCLSPDGRSIHSLSFPSPNDTSTPPCIITHFLPLQTDSQASSSSPSSRPTTITTPLPPSLLSIDPPIELLYASNHSPPTSSTEQPIHLCFYTAKSAHLLLFHPNQFLSSTEPFESHLLTLPPSHFIIRILSPCSTPSSHLYPSSSLILLLSDGSILLHHSNSVITSPLYAPLENVSEDPLTDMCFLTSTKMTLGILRSSGDIYALRPVIWEGCQIPAWMIRERLQELDIELDQLESTPQQPSNPLQTTSYHAAQYRRIKAERQYLLDAFVPTNEYYTISQILGRRRRCATSWPMKLQGPLVFGDLESPPAVCLQGLKDNCMVVGRMGRRVEMVLLGREVEVRFGFESLEDGEVLEERIKGMGAVLERVELEEEEEEREEERMVCLMVDPVMMEGREDVMVHYADTRGVFTVSSMALANFLEGKKEEGTDAWCCLAVGYGASLVGVVVSGDVSLGHVLVARLDTGSMEAVNLTAAQYIHQSNTLSQPLPPSTQDNTTTPPPFLTQITPLLTQITKTLSSMGKLIGSSTQLSQSHAGTVATLFTLRSKLEKGLILPLNQLYTLTRQRKKLLREMFKQQRKQLEGLKQLQNELRREMDISKHEMQKMEQNANELACKSATVLEICRELAPKISFAEKEYFAQLKRWENQCDKWAEKAEVLKREVENRVDLWEEGYKEWNVRLSEEEKEMCLSLLRGQKMLLTRGEDKLMEAQRVVEGLGVEKEEEGQ